MTTVLSSYFLCCSNLGVRAGHGYASGMGASFSMFFLIFGGSRPHTNLHVEVSDMCPRQVLWEKQRVGTT